MDNEKTNNDAASRPPISGPPGAGLPNPKPPNPKPLDPRPFDSRPLDPKPLDSRPLDPRPLDSGPLDPRPLDPRPLDSRPLDPRPLDSGPLDPGPLDPNPSDLEPSDPGLPDVPFLELSEGRLQGVVSSESQAERVYASSIAAGDHGLSCCSNDDLLCGGLDENHACQHIDALLAQAVHEFGAQRVARYLKIDVAQGEALHNGLHPTSAPSHAPEIFRSFLRHMTYLQMPVTGTPKL